MCLICVEIQKGQMTLREFSRASGEFQSPHPEEVIALLEKEYDTERLGKIAAEEDNPPELEHKLEEYRRVK